MKTLWRLLKWKAHHTQVFAVVVLALVATAWAGNVALGSGLGGLGGSGVLLGAAPAVGLGGVGIGSSVALLQGGPAFSKAVAGPAFLVRTVHHVSKIHGGGAVVAHSGLGGGVGLAPAALGGLGYGGLGGFSSGGYGSYALKG